MERMKRFCTRLSMIAAIIWFGIASVALASEFGSNVTFNEGDRFLNVIGSSGDCFKHWKTGRQVCTDWISFWEHYANNGQPATECAARDSRAKKCNNKGRRNLVGGHIVKIDGTHPHLCNDSTNARSVYILPICGTCNHTTNRDTMAVKEGIVAVKLKYYGGYYDADKVVNNKKGTFVRHSNGSKYSRVSGGGCHQ